MSRADTNGSKKTYDFGLLKTSQTKPGLWARVRFPGFGLVQKKLHLGVVLDLHFGAFVSSMCRKQGFNGCLKIASFLNRFLKHFGLPKIG